MALQVEEEDVPLIEEVGYKITDAELSGYNIRISVETPDSSNATKVISLRSDYAEEVQYIKDGEVFTEAKAVKRVKEKIKGEMKKLEDLYDHEFDSYDVIEGLDKVEKLCEEIR